MSEKFEESAGKPRRDAVQNPRTRLDVAEVERNIRTAFSNGNGACQVRQFESRGQDQIGE